MSLYQQTVNGEKNRFKLRMRFYDEEPESPCLPGGQAAHDGHHLQDPGGGQQADGRGVSQWQAAVLQRLSSSKTEKSKIGLIPFSELCDLVHAKGSIFVSYRSEAYIHPHVAGLRVTFDRDLVGYPYRTEDGLEAAVKRRTGRRSRRNPRTEIHRPLPQPGCDNSHRCLTCGGSPCPSTSSAIDVTPALFPSRTPSWHHERVAGRLFAG
jgi:hypothetical protein